MQPLPRDTIPPPTVRRLSLYLRQLETWHDDQRKTVSSRDLGGQLRITDAQVRKDFATFGAFGQPGVGYDVADLVHRIRRTLGLDRPVNVVLIGVGNLGRALLSYGGFAARSLNIVAVFDSDPNRIGKTVRGHVVQSMDELDRIVREHDARLAMLAVPPGSAQEAADLIVRAGIRGILDFAATTLHAPGVAVQRVDLAAQLQQLAFQTNAAAYARAAAAK